MATKYKYLIINADDFGRSENVNLAIKNCFVKGLITDCNLMVNMPGTLEAVSIIKKIKNLPVGIHFTLTSDMNLTNARSVTSHSSLTDNNGYFFSPNHSKEFWKKVINTWISEDIRKEINAQLKLFVKLLDKYPTHITSHHHIHAHPKILPIFLSIAKKYNLPLRIPIQQSRLPSEHQFVNLRKKVLMTDYFIADYKGNYRRATFKNFYRAFKNYSSGIIELMVHPAIPGKGMDKIFNTWWKHELNMLKSKSFAKLIKRKNIKLINYTQLKFMK